ncbi:MAG: type I DNA topoisomerase [Microcoleaceae cyanobacterium]
MSNNLLICESPGKIKKLTEYAGNDYTVIACYGHVRELSKSGKLGMGFTFDAQNQRIFCDYISRSPNSKKVLNRLAQAVKNSNRVVLATDEDREGEFISWHLWDALNLKNQDVEVVRVTFTEITKKAVQTALAHPRQIDLNLVHAAEARSCLDRLVGFSLSPMLWKTGTGAKSAGRCQSAALHILAERERIINHFKPQDYWLIRSHYVGGYIGNLVDETNSEIRLNSENEANSIVNATANTAHQVVDIEKKEVSQSPPPPFTTSSLQQAAGDKLNLTTKTTMIVAQKLYESGLITYMRTDSCSLSEEFCSSVKAYLQQHDPHNLPEVITQHRNKKSAQEGHEAIRPTHIEDTPERLKSSLQGQELQLYELIWNRAIASLCKSATVEKTQVKIIAGEYSFLLKGNRIVESCYAKYWQNLAEEKDLPEFTVGQTLDVCSVRSTQHQTEPPKRFTEPSLVKTLEKNGVGRPSTYATIINTLIDRAYVTFIERGQKAEGRRQKDCKLRDLDSPLIVDDQIKDFNRDLVSKSMKRDNAVLEETPMSDCRNKGEEKLNPLPSALCPLPSKAKPDKKNLVVTELGLKVDEILFKVVPDIIEPGFTAKLEKNLDEIANCQLNWEQWLINWNITVFQPALNRGNQVIEQVVSQQLTEFDCPVCGAKLKKHQYVKNKESKVMLRCSQSCNSNNPDCKDVAYFQSRGVFWSPKYGELSGQVKPQDSQNQNVAESKLKKPVTKTKTSVSEAVSKSPKLKKLL